MRFLILTFTIFIFVAIVACLPTNGADLTSITVEQALLNHKVLEGTEVTIQGQTTLIFTQTLQLCEPDTCSCNRTGGILSFEGASGDSPLRLPNGVEVRNDIDIEIDCHGNQCSVTCTPFNPYIASELKLVGTLTICHNCKPIQVQLEDIVVERSWAQVEGNWSPLESGQFTHNFP